MRISGAIFDLDGTVLNDEIQYGRAFNHVLGTLGVKTDEKYPQKGGIGLKDNWKYLLEKHKIKTSKSIEQLSYETQENFLKHLDTVTIKDGFEVLVDQLKAIGVLTALATSNDWHVVEKIFEKLRIEEYFDYIVTGDEALAKKPDPDIFITAARKLGLDQEDCIVFEDSEAGVIAAKRAKMRVIGIKNDERGEDLSRANFVVHGFDEVYRLLEKEF